MKQKAHYIRVSTAEQNTARQKEVIFGAIVFEEKESGLNVPNIRCAMHEKK
jgi:DNA invertase Pin-like site-specific DNA recombinase